MTESHLGGSFGKTHTDVGALKWAREAHGIKSMFDVGCSVGGQVKAAVDNGYERAVGIDGDESAVKTAMKTNCNGHTGYIVHDFHKDIEVYPGQFDLIWCVEFLEHIYPKYLPNVFQVIRSVEPKLLICTAAKPDQHGGYHHVNCRPQEYWERTIKDGLGMTYDATATSAMKAASTMQREFIKTSGMVYVR